LPSAALAEVLSVGNIHLRIAVLAIGAAVVATVTNVVLLSPKSGAGCRSAAGGDLAGPLLFR
jgi:hypothetical protein